MEVNFLDVLDRAHKGPVCKQSDWDKRVIPGKVSEKLREHGLLKTCDPQNPVNTDDGLADEYWRAGFELAVDVGMLCLDTERVIKFTEEELREALRYQAPSEVTIGEGRDTVTIKSRRPDEKGPMPVRSGYGPVSEDLFMPLHTGILRQRIIDIVSPLSLTTVYGRDLLAGTPYETMAGAHEAAMINEVLRRVGRPGMPVLGPAASPTEHGEFGAFGTPHGYKPGKDVGLILAPSELKTSYAHLNKVINDFVNRGAYVSGGHWSMIGGYVGPAEGAAIASIAVVPLMLITHQCTFVNGSVMDIRYVGDVGRDALWARSVSQQARARNTHLLSGGGVSQVSGPCTYEMLYEMAAGLIESVVSGCSHIHGWRSAGGRIIDHTTPLEQRFGAEVAKAATAMKRSQANDVVKALLPKYEDKLIRPSKGKSFTECYDVKSLTPTEEWLSIYLKAKKEITDIGAPML